MNNGPLKSYDRLDNNPGKGTFIKKKCWLTSHFQLSSSVQNPTPVDSLRNFMFFIFKKVNKMATAKTQLYEQNKTFDMLLLH